MAALNRQPRRTFEDGLLQSLRLGQCRFRLTGAIWSPRWTLRVQSILYNNEPRDIALAVASLARAADFAVATGRFRNIEWAYGDCSNEPCLSEAFLAELRSAHPEIALIQSVHFGDNLGSAGGHNRLLANVEADFVLILNPDVRIAPSTILGLHAACITALQPDQLGRDHLDISVVDQP